MALDVTTLVQTMTTAGQNLGGAIWTDIQAYAIPELRKIAIQIVAIEAHASDYTPAGAHALMDMQIRASVAVIVGMTTLTMLAIQNALNQILGAIKDMVNGAIGFALIA